jgi:hypothetical protein
VSNLFLVKTSLSAEDRFTAHWCGLLTADPELAQLVVDRLAELAHKPRAIFQAIVDHPIVTASDRPDCLLRTDKYDVICEHKLTAPAGSKQLERYMAHSGPRTYLALIATQRLDLPQSVTASDRYLAPSNETAVRHFLWRDFYPVIAGFQSPLAAQFRAYMEGLGMNPLHWGTSGDPFIDPAAASAFRELYEPLVAALGEKGIRSVRRRNSLGLQIRYPHPSVPLFYVAPTQWDGLIEIPLIGRLLTMSVWVNGEGETLPDQTGFVPGKGPTVFVSTCAGAPAHWRSGVYFERNYYVPLDQVLQSDRRASADLLQNVVQRALGHLAKGKSARTLPHNTQMEPTRR